MGNVVDEERPDEHDRYQARDGGGSELGGDEEEGDGERVPMCEWRGMVVASNNGPERVRRSAAIRLDINIVDREETAIQMTNDALKYRVKVER